MSKKSAAAILGAKGGKANTKAQQNARSANAEKARAAKAAKALKFWNGRGWEREVGHLFVAAYSRADAVRLINQAAGWSAVNDREIKVYFSPMWGTPMEGITRERGVWVRRRSDLSPERLI